MKLFSITSFANPIGSGYAEGATLHFEPSYDWSNPADLEMAQHFSSASLELGIAQAADLATFTIGAQYNFDISPA